MIYKGIIYYPLWLDDVAEIIGKQRWLKNSKTRNKNTTYKRGSKEQEQNIDRIGVLCELIALYDQSKKERHILHTMLLSKNPDIKNDLVIILPDKKLRYEVKGVIGNIARVNIESHNKKPTDFYLFIRPTKELTKQNYGGAYHWVSSYESINDWKKQEGQYGQAYFEKKIVIDAMDIIEQATKEMENK